MPTTDTKKDARTFDEAFAQAKALNEQVLGAARQAGTMWLESYEQAVERTIELELKVADQSRQEWLKNLIEAQAEVTREMTKAYTSAARTVLR